MCHHKTNWTIEDNKGNKNVVRSSHPPQEAITFKHRGSDIVASPFKHPTNEEKVVKKVIEQNNYTNQCLGVIGKQLDRIEDRIDNKVILQVGYSFIFFYALIEPHKQPHHLSISNILS